VIDFVEAVTPVNSRGTALFLKASPDSREPADPAERRPSALMQLALAAKAGNPRAMQRLLQEVSPRVGRVVRVVLGAEHPDRDDVEQLSLLAFTHALAGFRGECEPSHYASRIAVRTAVHARHRFRKQQARFDDLAELDEPTATSTHDDAVAERRKRHVRELLGIIPPDQAEALALRVALGWSLEEIAAAADTPVNTVRSRLRLAKEALRRKIEADPSLSEELDVLP
jgi:RNA polymerase sigma-70 factor (ECF subfamily)